MKKFLCFCFALVGFAVASLTSSNDVTANDVQVRAAAGGCVGNGACGVTANGTALIGKWVEVNESME